jgi:hypothetical protein
MNSQEISTKRRLLVFVDELELGAEGVNNVDCIYVFARERVDTGCRTRK